MSLESLVPPLEMCQQLNPGDFPNSALLYVHRMFSEEFTISRRDEYSALMLKNLPIVSAPTLAEIGEQLPGILIEFMVDYAIVKITMQKAADDFCDIVEDDANPATAALRLWMRVNGREVKK